MVIYDQLLVDQEILVEMFADQFVVQASLLQPDSVQILAVYFVHQKSFAVQSLDLVIFVQLRVDLICLVEKFADQIAVLAA